MVYEITQEQFEEFMVVAGSGVSYWAEELDEFEWALFPDDEHVIREVDWVIGHGNKVTYHVITRAKIESAVATLIREHEYLGAIADIISSVQEYDSIGAVDADTADLIVQTALFDEIIYG